jgi:tetratricopeptide (TPR) repeat protein
MEPKLKPLSPGGIAQALAKVSHYRYLNQSDEAESICLDVLAADPTNQQALRFLGLVLTDQFTGGSSDRYGEAEEVFQRLTDPYERTYYTGIAHERRAKAQLRAGNRPHALLGLFEEAMRCFEQAEKMRPSDNEDAVLRWNRCSRIIAGLSDFESEDEETFEASDSPPM